MELLVCCFCGNFSYWEKSEQFDKTGNAIEEVHAGSQVAPEGFPNNGHLLLILWVKKKLN